MVNPQFMTAAEQVEHGHTARGEPTYAGLQAINAELLTALDLCLSTMAVVSPEGAIAVLSARDAIRKAKAE